MELTQQVCFRVSPEDVQTLEAQAAKLNRPVSWVARDAMRKGLSQNAEALSGGQA